MTAQFIGSLVLWLIAAIVAVAVVVWLLHALYHRSTMEVSFVRTGLGGDKVIIKGGALVLPIIHEISPVGMGMARASLSCAQEDAVITKDRMRVDIAAEFYLHVAASREAVAAAAATLGRKTMDPPSLAEFFAGEFESAVRVAGAVMTLAEILENRADFISAIVGIVNPALAKSGLVLDTVAIRNLDQTKLEYFNPANRFDAEGLTELIKVVEERRMLRNDIEQNSMVAIRQRNLDAEKRLLELEREIENSRAAQKTEIAREKSVREAEAEMARIDHENTTRQHEVTQRHATESAEITAKEQLDASRLEAEKKLDEIRVQRELNLRKLEINRGENVELAEIDKRIRVLQKQSDEAQASIAATQSLTEAAAAKEGIATAREIENAKRQAAVDRIRADKEADAVRIAADARQTQAAIAAEAERLRNEAENTLTDHARETRLKAKMIDQLETLIRESVKPLEKVDSIKVVHVGGMGGAGGRSPTDEVIDSALRYRVQAPLIDELMKDIGVKDSKVAAMGDIFRAAKDIKTLTAKQPDKEEGSD